MIYKSRTEPAELTILKALKGRMNLNSKHKQRYLNIKKGYEGELLFDSFTVKLQCECLILNDLLLEANSTTFQIDSLIITQKKMYFYDVKNFEGDYYYESDKLYKKPELEFINPLHQLSRGESLLRQLLLSHGFNFPVDSSLVFINQRFTLYQAPLDKPIILPTQVKNNLNHLNIQPSKLTNKHKKLADQLISLHKNSPPKQIPTYDFEQLRKGMLCPKCHSLSGTAGKQVKVCNKCQHEEPLDEAILRSIKEYTILFPNKKITTNTIHQWCQIVPKRRIRNTLLRNFTKAGNHRWTYFE
ncbi:nuclease-related domain-containing protein [Virgibacillus oceani]